MIVVPKIQPFHSHFYAISHIDLFIQLPNLCKMDGEVEETR